MLPPIARCTILRMMNDRQLGATMFSAGTSAAVAVSSLVGDNLLQGHPVHHARMALVFVTFAVLVAVAGISIRMGAA